MSVPTFSNVLRLGVMCGEEKVSKLLNHPVMSLFGTRMNGTTTEMASHRIQLVETSCNHKPVETFQR
jgi:hypothetical protein